MGFNWQCPFCGHHAVIGDDSFDSFGRRFDMDNRHGPQMVHYDVIVCPNRDCREYSLSLMVADATLDRDTQEWTVRYDWPNYFWRLRPESRAKTFPPYIPLPILSDYREACLICEKSPKASATLSRRCLQGMIRDFWGVVKPRLKDEIEAIRERIDPATWEAVDALRKLGNIGAHMEQDINLIVDVDPKEADLLIDLLETLLAEWYVARHNREERMKEIKKVATTKGAAKKGGTAAAT